MVVPSRISPPLTVQKDCAFHRDDQTDTGLGQADSVVAKDCLCGVDDHTDKDVPQATDLGQAGSGCEIEEFHAARGLPRDQGLSQGLLEHQPRGRRAPLQPRYRKLHHLPAKYVLDKMNRDTAGIFIEDGVIGKVIVDEAEIKREYMVDEDYKVTVGEYWDPFVYVEHAVKCPSPFKSGIGVSIEEAELVVRMLEKGPVLYKRDVLDKLACLSKLAAEMEPEESEIKRCMHVDVRRVMENKRVALFRKLADLSGVTDDVLFSHLVNGFPLTGEIGATGRWVPERKDATMTDEKHKLESAKIRQHVMNKCILPDDVEAANMLKQVTSDEVMLGFLDGPYSPSSAVLRANDVTFARRFMIKQKDKWRPIDDFSVNLTNACVTTLEKARVDTLDTYIHKVKFMAEAALAAKVGRPVNLPDGTSRKVILSDDWAIDDLCLVGRCLDLANAYKQFAVNPAHARSCAIAVATVKPRCPEVYFTRVLPFGATASVYWFLRISDCLRSILTYSVDAMLTAYFDDYPSVSYKGVAEISQFAVEKVLSLLGIKFSDKPQKRLLFDGTFCVLGVQVDFPKTVEVADLVVRNTDARKFEVKKFIDELVASSSCSRTQAASLLGKLGFMSSQIWARVGLLLITGVRRRSTNYVDTKLGVRGDTLPLQP